MVVSFSSATSAGAGEGCAQSPTAVARLRLVRSASLPDFACTDPDDQAITGFAVGDFSYHDFSCGI